MNNFQKQNWNNSQQTDQSQPNQQQPNSQNQQASNQTQPSWIMQMAGACLPVLMKQFMGQGQDMMPAGSPSSGDPQMSLVLSQVLTLQQQIITGQQDLTRRIVNLETRASQQFTGLVKQVQNLSSVRLTHEKKSIDFNSQSENEANQY